MEGVDVRIWFWGWVVAAVAIAAVSVVLRDRASFPFAIGAAFAAALEAVGADPSLELAAFAGASVIIFAVANYAPYRPRHLHRGLGRHGVSATRED
jgi:membrane protein implicated in regulation of membrane protease activity